MDTISLSIKKVWEVIKDDVYKIVTDFWNNARLPHRCNTAFIALIPKIDKPSSFKDFRPISMMGCLYKIVAKLLTLRLQRVMNSLVGPTQSFFIEGSQILDSASFSSEVINTCKRKKTLSSLLKIDLH